MPTHGETLDIRSFQNLSRPPTSISLSLFISLRNQIHPNKLYGCQVQNNALQGSVY